VLADAAPSRRDANTQLASAGAANWRTRSPPDRLPKTNDFEPPLAVGAARGRLLQRERIAPARPDEPFYNRASGTKSSARGRGESSIQRHRAGRCSVAASAQAGASSDAIEGARQHVVAVKPARALHDGRLDAAADAT
jgi:hypothetical protein